MNKFRNFLVDYFNHEEIYYGALGYDPFNAKLAGNLDTDNPRQLIKDWIQELDDFHKGGGKISDPQFIINLQRRVAQLSEKVKGRSIFSVRFHEFENIITMELRGPRSQKSPIAIAQITDLLQSRIDYVNEKTANGIVQKLRPFDWDRYNGASSKATFRKYVLSMGKSLRRYNEINREPAFAPASAAVRVVGSGLLQAETCARLFRMARGAED